MHKIYSMLKGFAFDKFYGRTVFGYDSEVYMSSWACVGVDLKSAYRDGDGYGDGHFEGSSVGNGTGCGFNYGLDDGSEPDKSILFYIYSDA